MRDPYADLLRDSRGLRREQATAREAWYAALTVDRKEELLFELEMLLKGLVCWGNPRNHPGARADRPVVARDFTAHLAVAEAALRRCRALCTDLLGPQRRPVGYRRYLEPATTDEARAEAPGSAGPGGSPTAETPEDALVALRHGLVAASEVAEGLLRADKIPYRLFYAAVVLVQREVARNAFFNPLVALEFRPEFDRVRIPEVIDAIQAADGDAAHRLVALAYLGSYRLLRLSNLVTTTAADPIAARRSYALLAALRADARALVTTLRARAPGLLADGLERELMRVPASEIRTRFEGLSREGDKLVKLRATLFSVGSSLRAELRRSLEVGLPACEAAPSGAELGAAVGLAAARVREALLSNVAQLTGTLRGSADPDRLFSDRGARRAVSDRTRQAAWMFWLVTRAFVAKARGTGISVADGWDGPSSQAFVHEYLGYFRALGHQLAMETGYPGAELFIHALESLRDVDYVEPARLAATVTECEAFGGYLQETVEALGQRDELSGHPFDKHAAAESLRMYLGG